MSIVRFFFLLVSLFCVSCTPPQEEKALLLVGTSPDYPPFEYYENGQIMGYEIDLIKEIAKFLGKEIEIKPMDFNGLIPALNARKVDIAISTISRTKEREKNIDFSEPYHDSNLYLVYLKTKPLKAIDDMVNMKIGVQLGSTMELLAKEKAKFVPGLEIARLNSNPQLIEELKSGRIQGVLLEEDQVAPFVEKNPVLSSIELKEKGTPKSIALPKNSNLTQKINEALHELKQSGKLEELQKKWLKGKEN